MIKNIYHRYAVTVQRRYLRYRNRADLPNKCDTCAIRVEYPDDHLDHILLQLPQLQKYGLAKYAPRNIRIVPGRTHKTSFCGLGHITRWNQNSLPCPDWQLDLKNAGVSLSDHLMIHHARVSARVGRTFGLVGAILAVVAILIGYLQLSSPAQ